MHHLVTNVTINHFQSPFGRFPPDPYKLLSILCQETQTCQIPVYAIQITPSTQNFIFSLTPYSVLCLSGMKLPDPTHLPRSHTWSRCLGYVQQLAVHSSAVPVLVFLCLSCWGLSSEMRPCFFYHCFCISLATVFTKFLVSKRSTVNMEELTCPWTESIDLGNPEMSLPL